MAVVALWAGLNGVGSPEELIGKGPMPLTREDERETILLAEDEPLVRDLVREVLEEAGYRVLAACDGEEAISVFEEHGDDVDLALLDVIMPKKGGRAVWDFIRSRNSKLPVLFSSGYSREHLGRALGPHENVQLILKPLSPNELLRKTRELLDARET